jgi:predicted secreted protein
MVTAPLLSLLLGCGIAACGSGHGTIVPPLTHRAYIDDSGVGGDSGAGTSISVPGVALFVVPDLPASGYRWSLKLPVGVKLVTSIYDDRTTAPGEKHVRTFTFALAQPGMYVVKGAYVRPGRRKPARKLTLSIYGQPVTWLPPNTVFTGLDTGLGTDPGGVYAIVLKENPSSGYVWEMHFGRGLTVLHELTVTPSASSTRLVGAQNQHLWLFRVGKTSAAVTGSYVRPSTPTAPAARFSLKITVLPPGP